MTTESGSEVETSAGAVHPEQSLAAAVPPSQPSSSPIRCASAPSATAVNSAPGTINFTCTVHSEVEGVWGGRGPLNNTVGTCQDTNDFVS